MSKHTPGPWKIIRHEDMPNTRWIGSSDAESFGDGFATVWSVGKHNARLIAAAPELLEALQITYDALCISYPLHSTDMDKRGAIMAQARAAIAKATGEAK